MANFQCAASGHRPLDLTKDDTRKYAVHPKSSEYQEVHLCHRCASDARQAGVQTVDLAAAQKIIRQHAIDEERAAFFRSFIPATQEQSETIAS